MNNRVPTIKDRLMLSAMYRDEYFPDFLVDKLKAILLDTSEEIERRKPANESELFDITHAAVERINELQSEFEENDSDLDTVAREALAAEFEAILRAHGFDDTNLEAAIEGRDW